MARYWTLILGVCISRLVVKFDHHARFIPNHFSLVTGLTFVNVTWAQCGFASILMLNQHLARLHYPEMVRLTAIRASNWRDALRPNLCQLPADQQGLALRRADV